MGLLDQLLNTMLQGNNADNSQNNISAQNNASNAQNNQANQANEQIGFGSILGSLLGGGGNAGAGNNANAPLDIGSILTSLLGGGSNNQQNNASNAASNPMNEFLALAKQKFTQSASWIGTGANEPVSPGEVANVVSEDKIAAIAKATNHTPTEVLASLAEEIPKIVDAATPNGQLPGANATGNSMPPKA